MLAYTPDGRMPAVAVHDRVEICRPDAAGKVGPVLNGHRTPVRAVRFSPDSALLATADDQGTVRLWDAGGDHPVEARAVDAHAGPGNDLASAGEDGTLRFWMLPGPHTAAARPPWSGAGPLTP
ncbi:WD40 repeat domain-containing protein [Streptomyces sp. NPDC001502]|uniref:WD40 repeat domain-containing protein n=1 Tax=Streptomyces sp. NPDC001502 TaxID=3364578 RepID=UPI0036B7B12E